MQDRLVQLNRCALQLRPFPPDDGIGGRGSALAGRVAAAGKYGIGMLSIGD
jgi:hypothetical protein